MKTKIQLTSVIAFSILLFSQCEKDNNDMQEEPTMFKISIENVMDDKMFFQSGVFNTPIDETGPGPALPGNAFEFSFNAGLGSKLSFATMYGKSNDLFYGPSGDGIELYNNNAPISGDITNKIMLWDTGTEVNEEPGKGENQPGNGGPGVGEAENGAVKEISMVNDGFTYPAVAENIKVTISNDGGSAFTVKIENLAGSSTPIAPGAFVVHTTSNPLFEAGMDDFGNGLEQLAEDGNPTVLAEYLDMNSGYVSTIAPGVWIVHPAGMMPVFTNGSTDSGHGLEMLAEDGDPSTLANYLSMMDGVLSSEIYNMPVGSGTAGPLFPGGTFEFDIEASEGDYLSFASMLGNSNDLFLAPSDMGIALWNNSTPIQGDVTSQVFLWDAGTEVNEYPGAGIHQPARLNGGEDEGGKVMIVSDGFSYPEVTKILKVTITPM